MNSAQEGPQAQSHERLTAVAADIDRFLTIDDVGEEPMIQVLVMWWEINDLQATASDGTVWLAEKNA